MSVVSRSEEEAGEEEEATSSWLLLLTLLLLTAVLVVMLMLVLVLPRFFRRSGLGGVGVDRVAGLLQQRDKRRETSGGGMALRAGSARIHVCW